MTVEEMSKDELNIYISITEDALEGIKKQIKIFSDIYQMNAEAIPHAKDAESKAVLESLLKSDIESLDQAVAREVEYTARLDEYKAALAKLEEQE